MRCPDNEFSEHATGDMESEKYIPHILFNPEKSEYPDAARRQCEWWVSQVIVNGNNPATSSALPR
jgi:hypothetical protein